MVNQKLDMPLTLEILLDFTKEHLVQFVIPAVRVRKERIANKPMDNNQLHKGGIEQIAESMIATCPRGMFVASLDSDGLFVLSKGIIKELLPNEHPRVIEKLKTLIGSNMIPFQIIYWITNHLVQFRKKNICFAIHGSKETSV